jgi:predicted DNA-binding transcriptional regulator AlpA
MSPKTYSTSQVARMIGVSRQTLYSWIEAGVIDAPDQITAGGASLMIWTEAHIKAARKVKGSQRPGPKTQKKGGAK